MSLRRSPLDAVHRELGAKMVPFGGWDMPLQYGTGTLAEHRACRESAVVFDVSHLGTVRVSGRTAFDVLQQTLTNDLRKVDPGRAQYTHLLDSADGSVLDDIIVWWRRAELFDVMPNASNTDRVLAAFGDIAVDVTDERVVLAVQGPTARRRLATVSEEAASVRRFRVQEVWWDGVACTVAGTGYTGEDGVEISVPVARAADLWTAVTTAGVIPAGLGARDTLRLEAGLPLHGQDLGPGITPLQAGMGWVVGWKKGEFRGRHALELEQRKGIPRHLRGLLAEGRRPPRAGQAVLRSGEHVGQVTSGNFSPILGQGIAMALLAPDLKAGDEVSIDMRGTQHAALVAELPFIQRR